MQWFKPWRSHRDRKSSTSRRLPVAPRFEALECRHLMSIDPVVNVGLDSDDDAPLVMPLAFSDQQINTWTSSSTSSLTVSKSTAEKPQSKVWTHGGDWFAALPNSSGSWIWRLDNGNWTPILQLSNSKGTQADVKAIGNTTHILLFDGGSTQLASVQYVAATRSYELWSARPANVNISLPSSTETATIDVDSQGRMWLAYDNKSAKTIEVRYSDGNYANWSGPITVATGLATDDIGAVVAMGNGQIGVFWSNQNTKRFGFRTHTDGADPHQWNAAEVPAAQSAKNTGGGMADDHVNLVSASDGTLYVAVKTSYDSSSSVEIALLVRRPNGSWDALYDVSNKGTRPVVALNEALGRVVVAYTSSDGGGTIYYRESSTSSISFGSAQTLISGTNNNVTTTKQTFTNELFFVASSSSKAKGTLLVGPSLVPPPSVNQPPLANAGEDRSTTLGTPLTLAGFASDDGAPQNFLSVKWTLVSGPGQVAFANDSLATTTATFSTAGTYVLRLTAFDGALATSDDVVITVNNVTPPPVDPPPVDPQTSEPPMLGFWSFLPEFGTDYPSQLGDIGSLQGGATVTSDGKLLQNGSNQRYVVPNSSELQISDEITLSAWINPTKTDTQYVIKKGDDKTNGFELSLSSAGKVFVRFNERSSGNSFRIDSKTSYPKNGTTWLHIAATYDGTTIRLYVNGQLEASKNATFKIGTNNLPLTIGAGDGGFRNMRGQIDEVLVDNRAYSAEEIALVLSGNFQPPAPPIVTPPPVDPPVTEPPVVDPPPVDPPPVVNLPPIVNAGADLATTLGTPVTLVGHASDDGAPLNYLSLKWTLVNGPGSVTFGNDSLATTSATFSAAGTYTLRLTAFDGALATSDDVAVTVNQVVLPPVDPPPVDPPVDPAPSESSIVGFWNFKPGVGADYPSQLGNTGSLQGGATITSDGKLSQNGSNQRYVVPNSGELQISETITLSAWINPTKTDTQYVIRKADDSNNGFELSLSSAGKVFVRFNERSSGNSFRVDSKTSYPKNGTTWMHIAATYDGTTIRLYINGQLEASKNASFAIGTNHLPLTIGAGDGGFRNMRGQIDEVLVDNRAYSAEEIAQVLSGNFQPPAPPTAPPVVEPPVVEPPVVEPPVVEPPPVVNLPPVVSAGPDQSVRTNTPLTLVGMVNDDGQGGGQLATQWTVVSGPGQVSFSHAQTTTTSATFSAAGSYVLRLTAFDGEHTTSDDVVVTVTPSLITASGMSGVWKFDDTADTSGLNNHGTLLGGAALGAGYSGSGLRITGNNQRMEIPDSPSLDFTDSITIAAWIQPTTKGTQDMIKKGVHNKTDGYELSLSESGTIFVRFNQKSKGDSLRIDSTLKYPTNGTWTHVAATYDGTTIRLYINGQLQSSKAVQFTIATNDLPLALGSASDGSRSMRGGLDDVMVAGRALSASEILSLYQGSGL